MRHCLCFRHDLHTESIELNTMESPFSDTSECNRRKCDLMFSMSSCTDRSQDWTLGAEGRRLLCLEPSQILPEMKASSNFPFPSYFSIYMSMQSSNSKNSVMIKTTQEVCIITLLPHTYGAFCFMWGYIKSAFHFCCIINHIHIATCTTSRRLVLHVYKLFWSKGTSLSSVIFLYE